MGFHVCEVSEGSDSRRQREAPGAGGGVGRESFLQTGFQWEDMKKSGDGWGRQLPHRVTVVNVTEGTPRNDEVGKCYVLFYHIFFKKKKGQVTTFTLRLSV